VVGEGEAHEYFANLLWGHLVGSPAGPGIRLAAASDEQSGGLVQKIEHHAYD